LNVDMFNSPPPGGFGYNRTHRFGFQLDPVPEPSSALLLVFGMALSMFARNRYRRRA
jgi:hypothetical protein